MITNQLLFPSLQSFGLFAKLFITMKPNNMLVMKAQVQEKNCLPTMHYLQLQTSQFVFIMEDFYALCSSGVWDESPHDENVRTA